MIEAIISIFILTFGFIVMARLFNAGLHYEATSDAQQMAVVVANAQMEKIRAWNWDTHWAGNPSNTPFTDWTGVPGSQDPDFPEYTITVDSKAATLYSPCSELTTTRQITSSSRWVKVTVRWGARNNYYCLESLVAAPPAKLGESMSCTIHTPNPSRGEGLGETLTPAITDANGGTVPDVFFLWCFDPADEGYGTLTNAGTGFTVDVYNYILGPGGTPAANTYGGGSCVVDGIARARGIPIVGAHSGVITFAP